MHARLLGHGCSGRPARSILRHGAILVTIFTMATVVLYSGKANIGQHVEVSSFDDSMLHGLRFPDFDPGLNISSRFGLLFSSSNNGGGSTLGTNNITAKNDQNGRNTHSRLVVIPDLHGDGPQALRALRLAGLVSNSTAVVSVIPATNTTTASAATSGQIREVEWQWTGGDTVLVQLGDILDRGPDSLSLLIQLERLKVQARAAGGDVVLLLGNHELINIHHDFRYVSSAELFQLAVSGLALPPWASGDRAAAASTAHGRRMEEGAVAQADTSQAGTAHGLEDMDRELELRREEETANTEDALSLLVETRGAAEKGGGADRELLHGNEVDLMPKDADRPTGVGDGGVGGGGGKGPAGLSATACCVGNPETDGVFGWHHRRLLQQQHHHQRYLLGLEIWRDALAADAPLGSWIRQRPLAAIVDAGGCRILAVHAGAFPWMLRAVERLLDGGPYSGRPVVSGEGSEGKGVGPGASEPGLQVASMLQPEQYVAAWNAAVAAALRHCEGRRCRRRSSSVDGGDGDGMGDQSHGEDHKFDGSRLAFAELLLGGEGGVWSRRYDRSSRREVCAEVAAVVGRMKVQRLVVGHTVQGGGRVSSRCGGQLLMADVGLSRAIAGEMAVLQCTVGRLEVLYGSGHVQQLR